MMPAPRRANGRARGLPGVLARTFVVRLPLGAIVYRDPHDPQASLGTLPKGAIVQGMVSHARDVLGESRWIRRLGHGDWIWLGALEELR